MRPFLRPFGDRTKPPIISIPFYGLVHLYQVALSPFLGANCRFSPSCSQYLLGCLKVHYLPQAIIKGAWRVLRCNPWNPGGHDPVVIPENSRKKEGSPIHG